jgi:hypothetical protein
MKFTKQVVGWQLPQTFFGLISIVAKTFESLLISTGAPACKPLKQTGQAHACP